MKNQKLSVVLGSLAGAMTIQAVFIACGHMGGPPSHGGMDDAMHAMIGDARAQDGGGGPLGPTHFLTAETDQTRLVRGAHTGFNGQLTAGVALTDGPFVLTDFTNGGTNGFTVLYMVPTGTACGYFPNQGADNEILNIMGGSTIGPANVHGGRYLVPAGQTLCAFVEYTYFHWAGFRPYDGV